MLDVNHSYYDLPRLFACRGRSNLQKKGGDVKMEKTKISEQDKITILEQAGITKNDILSALGLDIVPNHKPYLIKELSELTGMPLSTIGKLVKKGKFGIPLFQAGGYTVIAEDVKEAMIKFVVIPKGSFRVKTQDEISDEATKVLTMMRLKDIKDSMSFNSKNLSELLNKRLRTVQNMINQGQFGPYFKIGRRLICIGKWVKEAVTNGIVYVEDTQSAQVEKQMKGISVSLPA